MLSFALLALFNNVIERDSLTIGPIKKVNARKQIKYKPYKEPQINNKYRLNNHRVQSITMSRLGP